MSIKQRKTLTKFVVASVFSLSLFTAPTAPVQAGNDAIAGALVGGLIGAAIANDVNRRKRATTTRRTYSTSSNRSRGSQVSSAQREQNRSVQHALNYFTFNVGGADGSLGPKSRAGISAYQSFLGYTATGQLTEVERNFLLTSHNRALAGGPATAQLIAANPLGAKGLLLKFRDEAAGGTVVAYNSYGGLPRPVAESVTEIARSADPTAEQLLQRAGFIQLADMNGDGRTDYLLDTSVSGSAFWCNATACAVRVFVSTPEGYERNDFQAFNVTPAMFNCNRGLCDMNGSGQGTVLAATPAPQAQPTAPATTTVAQQPSMPVPSAVPVVSAAAPAAGGLPTFFAGAGPVSLASHCNSVSLVTNTNGGFTRLETMSDPQTVLNEQFCIARTYAISTSETMMGRIAGFTQSEVEQQCKGVATAMQPQIASLSLKSAAEVRQEVASFILTTGMAPSDLASTARLCLGVGYRIDNMEVSLGSAMLLVVLGEEVYGELLGHHLSQGFGASKRADLSRAWYDAGINALNNGATAVFAPGQPDRTQLLQAAATRAAGGTTGPISASQPASQGKNVPVFKIAQ